jgi:two-component system chemotaxis response regulator CheY
MNTLLVDDSTTMRTIQRSVLAQIGFGAIVEAGDGQEALARAATLRPDLVLVDCDMPNVDGPTFVKAFRRTDRITPIIMVLTERQRAREIEAKHAGADGCLVKPFTPDMLSRRISEIMAPKAA